jgi:hypothetical protein
MCACFKAKPGPAMESVEVTMETKKDFFGIGLRPDPVERAVQVGRLCGIAAMLLRSSHPLVALLRRAERDEAALAQALDMVGALPSLTRRRLIASFAATQWLPQVRGT